MRRTSIVIALVLATAGPATAQPTSSQRQARCPVARVTLLGAGVGFGAGATIGFGLNVFEDTVNGEGKAWATVIGLTVAGAVLGNVLVRRECAAAAPSPSRSPAVVLTKAEVARLSRGIRLHAAKADPCGSTTPAVRPPRVWGS
jgi:hypothetical protein